MCWKLGYEDSSPFAILYSFSFFIPSDTHSPVDKDHKPEDSLCLPGFTILAGRWACGTNSAHMRRLLEDRQKNLFSDAHCAKIELTDVVQVLRGKERHLKVRW